MSFEDLGLRPELLAGVKEQGYTEPTPNQKQAIPVIIQGRDILAGAQTGTGKTAAFTLPLLHHFSTQASKSDRRPKALVLTPTRELAAQVGESINTYGKGQPIRTAIIYGGVGINPQIKRLRGGVDIVIGTPGRLLDLSRQKALDLSAIEVLVLDEADRMLDMGFIHDIRTIIGLVPKKRQTLFFSATYNKAIKTLADRILVNPELVEVAGHNTAAETVDQSVIHVHASRKSDLLAHLIKTDNWSQVLVFTRTKHGANRLSKQLNKAGIGATAIHGNKSQSARNRALADFKDWKVHVLVATDIAARGLDIDRLSYVVNFDLPNVPEDYVHRIGRTGRAGASGQAISLVASGEITLLRAIERLLKTTINVIKKEGFSEPAKHSRPVKQPKMEKSFGVDISKRRQGSDKTSFRRGSASHARRGNRQGDDRQQLSRSSGSPDKERESRRYGSQNPRSRYTSSGPSKETSRRHDATDRFSSYSKSLDNKRASGIEGNKSSRTDRTASSTQQRSSKKHPRRHESSDRFSGYSKSSDKRSHSSVDKTISSRFHRSKSSYQEKPAHSSKVTANRQDPIDQFSSYSKSTDRTQGSDSDSAYRFKVKPSHRTGASAATKGTSLGFNAREEFTKTVSSWEQELSHSNRHGASTPLKGTPLRKQSSDEYLELSSSLD